MKAVYPALLSPIADGDGYAARVPDIDGCITTGTDIQDTLDNIRDALAACICTLEDYNQPVPAPSAPESIHHDEESIIALLDIDTLKYREETDTRAVRKNVSMPAWLLNMADTHGINCSQVLQEALKRQLGLIS